MPTACAYVDPKPTPVILCCYEKLHPTTAITIAEFAPETEMVDVFAKPDQYWREIAKRWVGEEDLIVLEQDMEITEEAISSLKECLEPWCLYQYEGPPGKGTLKYSLGCTRFRKEFQRKFPRQIFVPDGKALDWMHVDVRISYVLNGEKGIEPHVHGEMNHLHDYASECPVYEDAILNNRLDRLAEGKDGIETFVRYLAQVCEKVVYVSDKDNPENEEIEFLENRVLNVQYLKTLGFVPEEEKGK